MSTRERRLKEYFESACLSFQNAGIVLRKAGCNHLAFEADVLARKIHRLQRTMTEPFDTEKVDLDTEGDEV